MSESDVTDRSLPAPKIWVANQSDSVHDPQPVVYIFFKEDLPPVAVEELVKICFAHPFAVGVAVEPGRVVKLRLNISATPPIVNSLCTMVLRSLQKIAAHYHILDCNWELLPVITELEYDRLSELAEAERAQEGLPPGCWRITQ